MTFTQWLRQAFRFWEQNSRASRRKCRQPSRQRCVPRLEWLEDRLTPSTFIVNSTADTTTTPVGTVTLREAILASENHTQINGTGPTGTGNDTIQFSPTIDGKTISLSTFINDATVAGPSAFLIGNSDTLVIDGETGLTQGITITRSGTTPFRLFDVDATGNLTLKGLTLSGGDAQGGAGGDTAGGGASGGGAAGLGGAIFNQGTLRLMDSTLTGNTAQGGAGGQFKYVDLASLRGGGGAGGGGMGVSGYASGTSSNGGGFVYGNGGGGGGPNGGNPGFATNIINAFQSNTNGTDGGFATGGGGGAGGTAGELGFIGNSGNGGFGGGGGGGASVSISTYVQYAGEIINYYAGNSGNGGFGGGGGGGGAFGSATPVVNIKYQPGSGGFGGGAGVNQYGGGGAGMGGAVFNVGGTVTITNSTLTANSAKGGAGGAGTAGAGASGEGLGGGIFNLNGTVNLTNDTIDANTATTDGGAVYDLGSDSANGITKASATVNVFNTILADSVTATSDLAQATTGTSPPTATINATTSLIQTGFAAINGTNTNNITGQSPLLGPLQNYGGWTKTMPLQVGSPAIDAGKAAAPPADQRGLPRDADGQGVVDIGAYERQEQTISFSLPNKTYGDPDFTISATAISNGSPTGLPVSFTSSDSTIASVSQDPGTGVWTVHINAAGTVKITAHQGGDTYLYNAAPDVTQTLTIGKATPTVHVSDAGGDFTGLPYPATGSVTGVNNSNLGTPTFQYFLASDTTFANPLPGAPTKVGSFVVVASYAGSANYTSAKASTSFAILSSQQQAGKLTGQVNNLVNTGVLSSGNGNALTTSLNNAAASFAANNATAGINQVTAFINKVNDFLSSGILTAAQAQSLINAANAIIASARPIVLVSSVGNTIPAGTPFSLTATVVDLLGNVVTTFSGTVKITDSVSGATLPGKYTFTTGSGKDNGVHTFTGLVLNTKGTQTLTVTDAKTGQLLGSLTVNVV